MEDLNTVRETTSPHLPPYTRIDKLILDKFLLERSKSEYPLDELRKLSIVKIKSYTIEVIIYADSSTCDLQANGGAGVFIEDVSSFPKLESAFLLRNSALL